MFIKHYSSKMPMDKMDKKIMVVQKDFLFRENYFQGFKPAEEINFESRILEHHKPMRRGDAEENPEFKQPIGYVVVVNPSLERVLAYQRSTKGGESRLHNKWSVGFGGHIEEKDAVHDLNLINASALRELKEEIGIDHTQMKVFGYLNDDSNKVGQVHFGIVYIVEIETSSVTPSDPEIGTAKLVTIRELESIISSKDTELEEWSKLLLKPLNKYLSSQSARFARTKRSLESKDAQVSSLHNADHDLGYD